MRGIINTLKRMTAVVMLHYLRQSCRRSKGGGDSDNKQQEMKSVRLGEWKSHDRRKGVDGWLTVLKGSQAVGQEIQW